MKNRWWIILGATLLVLLLLSTILEYVDVPDVEKKEHYRPDSQDPFGTWVLYNLLEKRYGADNVLHYEEEIEWWQIDTTLKYLYIKMDKYSYLNSDDTDGLVYYLNAGNDALFISEGLSFAHDIGLEDMSAGFKFGDTLKLEYHIGDTSIFTFIADSILPMNGFATIDVVTDSLQQADSLTYGYIVGTVAGGNYNQPCIYKEWSLDKNAYINHHSIPRLFSNIASKQDFYLPHFQKLIGQYNYDRVIIDHPIYRSGYVDDTSSPLQFILGHRSLRLAYYLMIVAGLLYVIFVGKRRQKVIPAVIPNKNTSLEYASILGRLYQYQEKPKRLVKHLKEIFYHDMKSRYFIDHRDEDYALLLAKKSQVPLENIQRILKGLEQVEDRFSFTNDDLALLYSRIQQFYKDCK